MKNKDFIFTMSSMGERGLYIFTMSSPGTGDFDIDEIGEISKAFTEMVDQKKMYSWDEIADLREKIYFKALLPTRYMEAIARDQEKQKEFTDMLADMFGKTKMFIPTSTILDKNGNSIPSVTFRDKNQPWES
jgi:hypothetical protein